LSATKHAYYIEDQRGKLYADWKTDLKDEEYNGYLPDGYNYRKVLELGYVESSKPGMQYGAALVREFLDSQIAKKAELIFLDPNPGNGRFFASKVPEHEQVTRLKAFYRQFGFRSSPGSDRMWLVRRGTIPDDELPA
jgi:hypothetical protein